MTWLIVFIAQFFFIMLKGLQQINVINERYLISMLVSFGLGLCGLLTMGIVAKAVIIGSHWSVYAGFLAGGPAGIASAIWIERRIKAHSTPGDESKEPVSDCQPPDHDPKSQSQ